MIILIHTSKTMRHQAENHSRALDVPVLMPQARELASYMKTLSVVDLQTVMHISHALALTVKRTVSDWTDEPAWQRPAIDSFLGDIYSGLQVQSWNHADRRYANQHLRILSGLYGILKPLDGISPYRLELGYKLPDPRFNNLYRYWGAAIVDTIPNTETIIDVSAVEYGKTITKYRAAERVFTPKFLTVHPKTGQPTFVVVHAKIARGAFASWLIRHRITDAAALPQFAELGYHYDKTLSSANQPTFVCEQFQGLGLSVRLTQD